MNNNNLNKDIQSKNRDQYINNYSVVKNDLKNLNRKLQNTITNKSFEYENNLSCNSENYSKGDLSRIDFNNNNNFYSQKSDFYNPKNGFINKDILVERKEKNNLYTENISNLNYRDNNENLLEKTRRKISLVPRYELNFRDEKISLKETIMKISSEIYSSKINLLKDI